MPNTDNNRNSHEFNELLIHEISSLKTDMRLGFSEIRLDIKKINEEFKNTTNECNEKFLFTKTFWKFAGVVFALIIGSYSYTTVLYKLLLTK